MPDVYAAIASADPQMQARIADVLELRAADPQQRQMLEQYAATLRLPAAARLLEIGCGTGAVSRYLVRLPGVAEVVGVDPCTLFVDRARELSDDPNVSFAVGDGRHLDLEDDSFDAVVFHTTLCHVPDCEYAIAEAHRVLRPTGQLAIFDGDYITATVATHTSDPLQSCVDAAVTALVHDPWLIRRLPSLLGGAGFETVRMQGYSYVQTSDADYMLTLIERGADALTADGRVTTTTAAALKAEAHARIAGGTFFGHIAYASLVTQPSL